MKRFMFLAGAAVAALAAPSLAQTRTATAEAGIQDIVVTANRTAEAASRVGMSITAVDAEKLTRLGVTDTADIARLVPGFTVSKSQQNTPIYTLRGIGFNTQNMSSTSPVGIYLNEVAYAYPYMGQGLSFDLERVEVLKGPQGTLYGRNTTGGLVNYIAAKPTDRFSGGATVTVGNYETLNFDGFVSGPISDSLGFRIAARKENSHEGWQRSVTRDDRLGEKDRFTGRAIVQFEPDDRFSATLTGSYWRDKSDSQAAQAIFLEPVSPPFAQPALITHSLLSRPDNRDADWNPRSVRGPAANITRPPYRVDAEFYGLSLRMNANLTENLSVTSLTGYNHVERDDTVSADGLGLIESLSFNASGKINSFSQELRATLNAGRHEFIAGGYYSRDEIIDNQVGYTGQASVIGLLRFVASLSPQTIYTPAEIAGGFSSYQSRLGQTSETFSLFANDSWEINDRLRLRAGVRYSRDISKFAGCSADYRGNTAIIFNTAIPVLTGGNFFLEDDQCLTLTADLQRLNGIHREKLDEDNISFRGVLEYTPAPGGLLYASISKGYKAGVFPLISANSVSQLAPATQESVLAYEAGGKMRFFGGKAQVNAAAFYYDYTDKQVFGRITDIVFGTLTAIVNIPKSRVYGAEVDLTVAPAKGLTLRGGGSYVNSRIKDYQGFNEFGAPVNLNGRGFTYTPRFQFSGDILYSTPLNEGYDLEGSVSATYQSHSTGSLTSDPRFKVKGYALANASVGIVARDSGFSARAWVRNLFDTYYWVSSEYATDTIIRYAGMPRTIGLSVGFKY